MFLPVVYHRVLRIAALSTWVILGAPVILRAIGHTYHHFSSHLFAIWLIAFIIFGPAFWISSETSTRSKRRLKIAALVIETAAVIVMICWRPDYFVGFLLVIVSWQLALYFTMRTAIIWVTVQTFFLLAIFAPICDFGWGWASTGMYVCFQAFAMVTAFVARSEAESRRDLAQTNIELHKTRELLAESARDGERVRISRELHDLLGHSLTALSLHLEVASHKAEGSALKHVQQAQSISKTMLGDVRGIVTALRNLEEMDLKAALEMLSNGIPQIQIHLRYPENLKIQDTARSLVLIRCVQEIITNTLKHSAAKNLWIEILPSVGGLDVRAHDDGRGQLRPEPGLGLSNMRDRLEEVGGHLSFQSMPKDGFHVNAWLPLRMEQVS